MNANNNPDAVRCTWATTPDALREVFQLRYLCYRRSGAIAESPDELFTDPFDLLPNHFSFLLSSAAEGVLATMRVSVVLPQHGWASSPSAKVFGDDREFQSIAGRSYVEASRLCFRQAARRGVLYRLFANLTAMADHYGAEWLVACPRVEHSHLYQRQFGFRQLAPSRQYFGVGFQTDLLATSVDAIRATAHKVPSMRSAWTDAASFIGQCMQGAETAMEPAPDPCLVCGAARLCGAGCPV